MCRAHFHEDRPQGAGPADGRYFSGLLFGGQAQPLLHKARTLLITEGEINAMSIWQVAHESRLDVLSVGSESARLTPAMLQIAQQYGQVLIWADRAEVGCPASSRSRR